MLMLSKSNSMKSKSGMFISGCVFHFDKHETPLSDKAGHHADMWHSVLHLNGLLVKWLQPCAYDQEVVGSTTGWVAISWLLRGWVNHFSIQGRPKNVPLLLSMSSPIIAQFPKFFHWLTRKTVCDNVIVIDPTTM